MKFLYLHKDEFITFLLDGKFIICNFILLIKIFSSRNHKKSFNSQGNPINILSKELLNSDSWVRESIFKKTFLANKLPYYSPHRFRKTLARAMKKESNSTMLSIALAQNIGHKNEMALIFQRYGDDYSKEQANLMKSFKLE